MNQSELNAGIKVQLPHPVNFIHEIKGNLFERISSGDNLAINECLDLYGNKIWALAGELITDLNIENVVREIFLDIWQNAPRFDATRHSEEQFIKLIAVRRIMRSK